MQRIRLMLLSGLVLALSAGLASAQAAFAKVAEEYANYEFAAAALERSNSLRRLIELKKAGAKGLVWLKPFGFTHCNGEASPSYTSAVLRVEVINNFPALPRVIGKLANVLNDDMYAKLIKSVESGEKPKKAARDFLISKKLI